MMYLIKFNLIKNNQAFVFNIENIINIVPGFFKGYRLSFFSK
jgi:hypothetical protein